MAPSNETIRPIINQLSTGEGVQVVDGKIVISTSQDIAARVEAELAQEKEVTFHLADYIKDHSTQVCTYDELFNVDPNFAGFDKDGMKGQIACYHLSSDTTKDVTLYYYGKNSTLFKVTLPVDRIKETVEIGGIQGIIHDSNRLRNLLTKIGFKKEADIMYGKDQMEVLEKKIAKKRKEQEMPKIEF